MPLICIYCEAEEIKRNGILPSGGQRRRCSGCHANFSIGGTRETYTPYFKHEVAMQYIHTGLTAKQIVEKYHISTRTLIERSKKHKQDCPSCYDETTDND